MIPVLLALGALVNVRSRSGARQLQVDELITGVKTNSLREDEFIESVRVPVLRLEALISCPQEFLALKWVRGMLWLSLLAL